MNAIETLCPSIEVHIDFDDGADDAAEHADTLESFLATVPGRSSSYPVVELVEDDEAVYLKGTFWLARYDEQLACDAAAAVDTWAAEQGLDATVNF